MRILSGLTNFIAILSVYPIALSLSVAVDTFLGPGAFWDEVKYGSRERLLVELLQDWASSAIFWLPISLLVLLCVTSRWRRGCSYVSIGIGLLIISTTLMSQEMPIFFAATIGFAFIVPALVNLRHT